MINLDNVRKNKIGDRVAVSPSEYFTDDHDLAKEMKLTAYNKCKYLPPRKTVMTVVSVLRDNLSQCYWTGVRDPDGNEYIVCGYCETVVSR